MARQRRPPQLLPDQHTGSRQPADKKGIGKKLIAGIASVAVLGGGAFIGVKSLGGGEHTTEPKAEPTSSAPATPGEKAPSNHETAAPETLDFTLSAETYINNPKQLIIDYYATYNDWQNTGYSKKAATDTDRFSYDSDMEYSAVLDKASNDAFESDMLVANWQENPNLVKFINNDENVHAEITTLALKTGDGSNREDLAPYQRFTDLDQSSIVVQSATPDKIIVSGLTHGRDNSDQNTAEETSTGIDPNEEHGGQTLTFVKVGDQFRLADVTPYAG
jgi:hypothetical protein